MFQPSTIFAKKLHLTGTSGLQDWCFPLNIAKFLRTPNLKNICQRQLLFFEGFEGFFELYLAKYLSSILNSPSFIFLLTVFRESNAKQTNFFFHKICKNFQEKVAYNNFVLFSCSRNMIGQFIKTYLHRPIKNNFSHKGEFKNV